MPPPPVPAVSAAKEGDGTHVDGVVVPHPTALEVEFDAMWEAEGELDEDDLGIMRE